MLIKSSKKKKKHLPITYPHYNHTLLGFYHPWVWHNYFISQKAILGWTSTIAIGLINSILTTAGIIVLGLLIVSNKNRINNRDDIFFKEE